MSWNIQKPGDYINGPLTVAGSATITGDLTVDTSTLKVDSTNDRVGVVQATPLYPLHLVGEFGLEEASSGNGTKLRLIGDATKYNFRLGKQLTATNTFEITPSTAVGGTTFSNPVYTVTYDGIHTFLDGVGGTRMTLNSTGLGIGASPRAKLDVNGGLLVNNYTTSTNYAPLSVTTASTITTPSTFTNAINIWNSTTVGAYSNITFGYNALGLTNAPAYIGFVSTNAGAGGFGDLVFGTRSVGTDTAATERVRIDASGNLLVDTTSASGRVAVDADLAVYNGMAVKNTGTTYGASSFFFRFINSSGVTAGSIQHTAVTTTNYSTTSDSRLKESKGISTDTSVIDNTIVRDFVWKADGSTDRGVFAQEAQSVKPRAISAGSDDLTEDGNIKTPWSVDYSKYVPDLIVYCQQLKKQVVELTTRVQTLEAR